MKKVFAAISAAAMVSAALVAGSGTASATGSAPDGGCTIWNNTNDIIYVYSRPDSSSPAWGYLWPGRGTGSGAPCWMGDSTRVWGTWYTACGATTGLYDPVYFEGTEGYVQDSCATITYW